MLVPIVFEDDQLLCINKPPGVVVNRAQSVTDLTIQDWMLSTYPSLFASYSQVVTTQPKDITHDENSVYDPVQEFVSRNGIVHRIDKETSGLLLIAKNPEVFAQLKSQFMERSVKKIYRAIIHGTMPATSGSIDAPVGRLPWNRERFGVVPDGKPALTRYSVVKTYERKLKSGKEKIQLIECYPETGRTHQIRVHLKYTNRPIVGDYLYAGRKTARDDRAWVARVQLHAYQITFKHPITNEPLTLVAELPTDMRQVLDSLQLVD